MHVAIRMWRACRVCTHLVRGLATIRLVFPQLDQAQRELRIRDWASDMLVKLGIELVIEGTPPAAGPVMLVANHISWLDIVVIHAARYCCFVAKSDVQRWPLIGALATGAGTLYVKRSSRSDTMRVVHQMGQALIAGDIVAVFPEGTTSDGSTLLPFHGNLIQAAITANAPVQPVALRFIDRTSRQTSTVASYTGDHSLVGSIWRTLGERGLRASVVFGEPQFAEGRDRRIWARDLRAKIVSMR